jgi:pimeloyl-ACP methyl ester carboxylesterase
MRRVRNGRAVLFAAGLPVAGLAGFAWVRYLREIRRERMRASTGSEIAETRCGSIEYAEVGSGPPVLLVHGAGGGYDQGLLLGRPLAEKGFHVVAMSRFGYLRTPLPDDASAEAQADAHAALLDTLGIGRAAVVGASAGAPSAMQFALRHPDRASALVLLVPASYAPREGDAPPVRVPPGTRRLSVLGREPARPAARHPIDPRHAPASRQERGRRREGPCRRASEGDSASHRAPVRPAQ